MKIKRNQIIIASIIVSMVLLSVWVLTQQQSIYNIRATDTDYSFTRIDIFPDPDWTEKLLAEPYPRYYVSNYEGTSTSRDYVAVMFHVQFFDLQYQSYDYTVTVSLKTPMTVALATQTFTHGSSSNSFSFQYSVSRADADIWTLEINLEGTQDFDVTYGVIIAFVTGFQAELPEVTYTPDTTETTEETETVINGEEEGAKSTPYYLALIPIIVIALKRKKSEE